MHTPVFLIAQSFVSKQAGTLNVRMSPLPSSSFLEGKGESSLADLSLMYGNAPDFAGLLGEP